MYREILAKSYYCILILTAPKKQFCLRKSSQEDMLSTRETPPDPSSHIVLTFTSATNSPVTTWKCDANHNLSYCKLFNETGTGVNYQTVLYQGDTRNKYSRWFQL